MGKTDIDYKKAFADHPKMKGELSKDYMKRIGSIVGRSPLTVKQRYEMEDHTALKEECDAVGIPIESVGHYWHKGKNFSIFSKNGGKTYESIKDEIIGEMKSYSPKYPTIKRSKVKDEHLLVIDPADVHIGKLCKAIETGEEYNSQVAIERVLSGVNGLLDKAQGFPVNKILLVIGNDILHVDNAKRTTTSGTPQDTDGMWYDNFMIAKDLYVKVIENILQLADVHVHYNPSNHDYTNGFFLADTLSTWFRNSKNIEFNVTPAHRKYYRYGTNLIATTHGDGAKDSDLPLLMAQESKDWTDCRHRYIYTHHIHHKKSKDYGSVCVESLRSPSGTDSWHHRNGYQHSPKAVEAYIHHPEYGQICRLTHIF
jgi:hypothetical protein